MAQEKKWSIVEEDLLCKAWTTIMEDEIEGVNQASDTFWDRVRSHYQENWEGALEDVQTIQALSNRWEKLIPMLTKWHACLMKASDNYRSGSNLMDEHVYEFLFAFKAQPIVFQIQKKVIQGEKQSNKQQLHSEHIGAVDPEIKNRCESRV
ncbi:hypothetical protein CerSpe_012840 [Prunus speciosa]